MRVGLEQFASNPMLAGMAESMPELKAVLDNPALMEESIAQAQKLFSGMAEGGLGGLGGPGIRRVHLRSKSIKLNCVSNATWCMIST